MGRASMNNLIDRVKKNIRDKLLWIKEQLVDWPSEEVHFYIAGGALAGDIRDLDIYPVTGVDKLKQFESFQLSLSKVHKPVFKSKNACTFNGFGPWPIQLCSYKKLNLKDLLESFDFAHIQIGAQIQQHKNKRWDIRLVHMTEAYLEAKLLDTTWYTGSEYPMSSMIRAAKYYRRDVMNKGRYISTLLMTLHDIVNRGFCDYEDFKDQLDAVDLGMLPDELRDMEEDDLLALFKMLEKPKKV